MKLAIICSSGAWGGLEINIFNVCKWLSQSNIELVVFTKTGSKIDLELKAIGIHTIEFDQKGKKHLQFANAKYLAQRLDKHHIKNVLIGHYEQHYTCVLATLFSKNRLNIIYMQHNIKKFGPYYYLLYKRVNTWLTPLESLKEQLLKNTHLSENQIKILPLCLETDRFYKNTISKAEAKAQFGYSENDFIIGTIGRLDKEKGQETILKAAEILKNQIPQLKILLAGEETAGGTGYKNLLLALANKTDINDNMQLLPFQKDTPNLFKALDVFIMSSKSEPYGMVTLEALLSGTNVIGTNSGGTIDLLNKGKYGQLYAFGDANTLASHILNLYNLKETVNAQDHALEINQKYSHLVWVEEFCRLLN